VQVAAPPTTSEFREGIIGVTLRPVPGADFVSPITDEHFLQEGERGVVKNLSYVTIVFCVVKRLLNRLWTWERGECEGIETGCVVDHERYPGLFPISLSEISEILVSSAQRFEPGGFIEPRRFRIFFP